jgi:hypothetical protein
MDQFGFNFAEKSELARWINEDYDARLDMLAAAVTAEGMEINSIGHDDTEGLIVNVIDNGAKGRFKQTLVIGETSFEVTFNRVSSRRRFKALVISKESSRKTDEEPRLEPAAEMKLDFAWKQLGEHWFEAKAFGFVLKAIRSEGVWWGILSYPRGDEGTCVVIRERRASDAREARQLADELLQAVIKPIVQFERERAAKLASEILESLAKTHLKEAAEDICNRDHVLPRQGGASALRAAAEIFRRLGIAEDVLER